MLPGASLRLDGVRGLGIGQIHCNLLELHGDIFLGQLGFDSDGSADFFNHLQSCLEFLDQLCFGHTRDLIQPVHSLLGQVQGEGPVI